MKANQKLAKALRDLAHKLDTEGGTVEAADQADAGELIRSFARVIEGKSIEQALGAPGDWGYDSPIGSALFALLQEPEPATKGGQS